MDDAEWIPDKLPPVPTHDQAICFCGTAIGCTCPCERCEQGRRLEYQSKRLMALEARLVRGGIDIEDFAEVIWRRIEPAIEARMEKMVIAATKKAIRSMTIVSRVDDFQLEE